MKVGHSFTMRLRVTPEMVARFFDCTIHPLYATFALVEHAEYASRCAILPFLTPDEDAVGSAVEAEHTAPTPVDAVVTIEARIIEVAGRSVVCAVTARNADGEIGRCTTRQQIVRKGAFQEIVASRTNRSQSKG